MIQNFEGNPVEVLRSTFVPIWNTTGLPKSMNSNNDGEWIKR